MRLLPCPTHPLRCRPLFGALLILLSSAPAAAQRSDRAPDGLLRNPALQTLVDRQVARDGAALRSALTSPDAAVRARAAFALASVQDSSAAPALVALLGDPVPAVRADAAFALGQASDSTHEGALVAALRAEPDATVRARLFEALGKTGGRTSLAALATLPVATPDAPARALAIARYGLRNVHHPEAVRLLVAALTAPDARLRRDAAYYFGRIRPAAPWASETARVRAALDGYAPDEEAAMHLLLGLGRLNDPADTPRLARWLRTAPDWRTRTSAARALATRLGEADAATALRAALDDRNPHVALAAAEGFGAVPALTPDVAAGLRMWITAHPRAGQIAAALAPALVRAGEEAFVADWALRQPTARVRGLGLAALGAGTRPGLRDTLFTMARSNDATLAASALSALAARWSREKATLAPAARDRYFAAFTLGVRRGDVATVTEAADPLADSLFRPLGGAGVLAAAYRPLQAPRDVDAMTALLGALGAARDVSAVPLLREAAGSPALPVARAATAALRRITGERLTLPAAETAQRQVDWAYLARYGARPRLRVETDRGRIVIELDAEEAPLTTQTLLQLAEARRFDGVPFHRVVSNFVIQGGDVERGDGNGGPGFAIRSEFTRRPYEPGTAGMASSGKDTEGSQWFVTHSMQPHLDGRYTAFGHVVDGLGVVDRIVVGDRARTVRVVR